MTTSSRTRSTPSCSLASPSMPSRAASTSCPRPSTSICVILRMPSSSSMTSTRLRPRPVGGCAAADGAAAPCWRRFGPADERLADGFDARLRPAATIGVDVLERAVARGLDELGARARDGIGADDGDAALQRVRRAIERLAIAVRGGLAHRLHLARALAHQRIDELRDERLATRAPRGCADDA